MQHSFFNILSATFGRRKRILDATCLLFCLMILVPIAGCSAKNIKPDEVIKTGASSYSVKNLDFCKVSDKETCRLISIDSAYNTVAVSVLIYSIPLLANTSREIVLLYDMEGKLQSQINVHDAIGADKVIVDAAIDTAGNLAIFARAQSDDNVVHNYLYSFDSEGKLAGDPIELTFGESIIPTNFIIGTDGKMLFGKNLKSTVYGGHQIDVLDSRGNMLFVIGDSRIVGNLYQSDDVIYTDSNKGGTDSYNSAQLLPIDTENPNLGDSIDISEVTSSGGVLYAGSDGFYLLNAKGIYSINLDSQATNELILWKDTDMDLNAGTYDVFPAAVISEDKILLFSSKTSDADSKPVITVSLLTRK